MNVADMLPHKQQDEINPIQEGDYYDDEGLLVCGVCKKRKQHHVLMPTYNIDFIAPVICDCRKAEIEQEEKKRQYEEKMNRIKAIRAASLMPGTFQNANFEGYIRTKDNEKAYTVARNFVDNFAQMKKKNQGIIFYGSVGTGKSFTSACIANALMEQEVTVLMTSFVKILQEIQGNIDGEAEYLKAIDSADLLIVDDLGAERNTSFALEKVYNVVDSRVRAAKPMILTTNLTMEEMGKPAGIEYQRIYDRIFEVCYPVAIYGQSLRMSEALRRQREMKQLLGV